MSRLTEKLKIYRRRVESKYFTRFYYITDKGRWSFSWDAHYIVSNLKELYKLPAKIAYDGLGFKKQLLHFGNRYAYLNGSYDYIHSSNVLTLTWFHGASSSINPRLNQMLETLLKVQDRLTRIVVSCNIAGQELVEAGIDSEKIIRIPLGVDLNLFRPAEDSQKQALRKRFGIPEEAICVGSFVKDGIGWGDGMEPKPEKGPDIFLETVSMLHKNYPNLLIVLTGPARGYVKQGLSELGIQFLHKYLDNFREIVQYYQLCDLVLITSRTEGGPKALLESWASGVPVVSTRVGMCADLIETGVNGILTDCDNVDGLYRGALLILEDKTKRKDIKKCQAAAVKQYDWSAIAGQYYEKLYLPLVGTVIH